MASVNYLFVYGTLRKEVQHPMHNVLTQCATYIGMGTFQGKLYDLGCYPGAVPSPEQCDRVIGEIYKLQPPARVFANLDDYEGRLFRREPLPVWQPAGNKVTAWVYLYRGPTSESKRIAGGDYLLFCARLRSVSGKETGSTP
jgi:gamma-glutamylcyclotransferase (GGCT)/AIG2-like uncharacterized protein YtfP